MAEPTPEVPNTAAEKASSENMDIEMNAAEDLEAEKRRMEEGDKLENNENGNASKKAKVQGSVEEQNDENGDASKKAKVQDSVEEKKDEKLEGKGGAEVDKQEDESGPVTVGPKTFGSSLEMFEYFYKFLHYWTPNINVNKYENIVLLALLNKGHSEPEKKIGCGVKGFQVRFHPKYKSRCFFIIREDGSTDDFSFRKCVDNISPLPENMPVRHEGERGGGGRRGGGRGRGRGRGHGRGKWRN